MTMKSLLLGVIGFIIVIGSILGGILAAGVCQNVLTPQWRFLYPAWLWIGFIPMWWLASRTPLCDDCWSFRDYMKLLPVVVILGIVQPLRFIQPILWIVIVVGCFAGLAYLGASED